MSTSQIGLDEQKSKELAKGLNELLANYSIFYQNVRGYHWNVKGHHFFELHAKFEELYNDLKIKIDEVAERILTLGYTPEHNFTSYNKLSSIQEEPKYHDGVKMAEGVVSSLQTLIQHQRGILKTAETLDDEGTIDLIAGYISEQEKTVWMYNAFIQN